jgi:hypothetical protein
MVVEYRRTHRQGVARDGDGGGGYTKQFWGNVMRLGGGSLTSFGVYLVVKGALKNHRFHKQYRDDYSPPGVQPAAPMSLGTARALRKKISGIAMVGTGSALQVAGLILLNNGNKYSTDRIIGQAALLAGTGLAVPGTFLWIKGAREQRVYRDYPSIHSSLSLYLAPMPTLCYRF